MLHRVAADERLATLPVYKELLRVYTTHEIIQCVTFLHSYIFYTFIICPAI